MNGSFNPDEDVEFQRRADRLSAAIRAAGLSQLVVTDTESIFYLSGASFVELERPILLIVDVDGGRNMVVPFIDRDLPRKCWRGAEQVAVYREYPAPAGQSWKDMLFNSGYLREGFGFQESTSFEIASVLEEAGGMPCDLLGPLRMVKSDLEVQWISRAARCADWALLNILKSAYNGVSVAKTFAVGQQLMFKIIQETPNWDALTTKVTCGAWPAPLSAIPHSIPRLDMQLACGPHLAMSMVRVQGYAAETERTFFTQPPSEGQRELFALMLEANQLALSMVRPGISCTEIDQAVNQFFGIRGYSDHATRLHRSGHGLGLGNHEPPWIAEGSDQVLKANMLLSIEPGLYISDAGGYRHTDTVLVTENGYRLLTKAPKAIEDLVLPESEL
ncbi:M24 family metallopeptidase [Burkholderia arboris]|uniref:M24 family metallopeptidase n=1 Tax=Burkholderia arboris TaxID=488730 RepID=UPI001CA45706|nr:Xaa-Pro peptidase family protein [Burkholderia arboris]MBY8610615.1 Xaa-Pro peptidase family protein [Burkholderia arboris]MCA8052351.1 Xaa-Pro peptidase family protein [Burkholderia arboris]